jgi:hypothetical protein
MWLFQSMIKASTMSEFKSPTQCSPPAIAPHIQRCVKTIPGPASNSKNSIPKRLCVRHSRLAQLARGLLHIFQPSHLPRHKHPGYHGFNQCFEIQKSLYV